MKRFPIGFVLAVLFSMGVAVPSYGQANCGEVRPECNATCQAQCAADACATAEASRLAVCFNAEGASIQGTYELCNDDLSSVLGFECTVYRNAACQIDVQGTGGFRLCEPNLSVASVLSGLDIDGDRIADSSADTDGDGLPDSWEVGGVESNPAGADEPVDRVVFYPSPSAIVPGTPPTPIFARRAVATDALRPDTDGDGLTDFTEVFGLMFIDEDHDGLLDGLFEWGDSTQDGLPSPGEHPLNNSGSTIIRTNGDSIGLLHDFDGFVFTDPTNPDTDGDSVNDGEDIDPLINLRAFGNQGQLIVRFNQTGNPDIDQDGLGNSMDMGNDLERTDEGSSEDFQTIDNPQDLEGLLRLFREDLLVENKIPESQIEDLLGIDWDGNGLWRTTDVRNWSLVIEDPDAPNDGAAMSSDNRQAISFTLRSLFRIDPDDPSTSLFATQTFEALSNLVEDDPTFDSYGGGAARRPGAAGNGPVGVKGIGLGWQELLKPTGPSTEQFIPDDRIWAILYSWRMPGFDIDGDGFVGPPNLSGTVSYETANDGLPIASIAFMRNTATGGLTLSQEVKVRPADSDDRDLIDRDLPFDDFIPIEARNLEELPPELDGVVEAPSGFPALTCGSVGGMMLVLTFFGLITPRFLRKRTARR